MSKRRIFVLGLLAASGAILLGSWFIFQRPASENNRKITIAQVSDFFLYAPLYVARDAGFFQRNGLDVSIINTGGDEKSWAAVLSGDAQFSISDPTFIPLAVQRKQPGTVIGTVVNGVPFWGVTYEPEIKPFQSVRDLNSYSVATFPSPSTAYTLQKRMYSMANQESKIVEGAFGTLLTIVKSGRADIALELEPNVSQAVSQGAHVVYSLREVYGDFAITGISTMPQFVSNSPDVVRRTLCSLQMALDLLHREPEQALSFLRNRFPDLDRTVSKDALTRVLKQRIIPTTLITGEKAWSKAVDLRVAVGDLKEPKPMDNYVNTKIAQDVADDESCRLK